MLFSSKKKIEIVKSNEVKDFKKLANLVKIAVGHNTIPEFAGRNGIPNYAKTILSIINKKITTYPELWLLQKISNGSELRVSFDELRIACGYSLNDGDIDLREIKPFWGGLYLCNFGNFVDSIQGGIRPACITQNNIGNDKATITWAIPISTKLGKRMPMHIEIDTDSGLERKSELLIEQMRVITKRDLLIDGHIHFLGEASESVMKQVSIAIMKQAGMVSTKASESTVGRFLDKLNEYVSKAEESRLNHIRNNNFSTTPVQQQRVASLA